MSKNGAALVAGFAATLVLSAIMVLKSIMGLMPDVNVISMLSAIANGTLGTPSVPAVGWVIHFLIGTVLWGLIFAAFYSALPTARPWSKGMVFSIGAWLLMMIIVMPIAGAGFFGVNIGIHALVATLILHLIYGAVLGAVYARRQVTSVRLQTADTPR